MANAEHIEKLSCGAKVWNAWRSENRGVIPDFSDAEFTLSQRQLGPVDQSPVNLQHANLQNAFLYYGLLTRAKLCNADFRGANLAHARLEGADLTAANLEGAVLENADLNQANLAAARLENTDLSSVRNLTQHQLETAKGNSETRLPKGLNTPSDWLVQHQEEEADEEFRQDHFVRGHTSNFYALLNITELATDSEIRSAYRKMAKAYHPDLHPGNPKIAEQFQLLTTVYKILSDPEKRRHYDLLLAQNTDTAKIQAELFG